MVHRQYNCACMWRLSLCTYYVYPHLQVKHPLRDWRNLGECQKVIKHSPGGGIYEAVSVNSEGLLAVTDVGNKCVHLLTKEGALVRSIGKGVLGSVLPGVVFDLKGSVWVVDHVNNRIVELSQDGRLLQTVYHAGSESDGFSSPCGMSISTEGLIYICDRGNHRVTVHDEEGKFLFGFGSKGSGSGCFEWLQDVALLKGSDGLVYVTDWTKNMKISVWSKEGSFKRIFQPKYDPTCIAATSDNHLLITSFSFHTVMVYTLEGELVHEFARLGSNAGGVNGPWGICIDNSGVVYVVDKGNNRIQVF